MLKAGATIRTWARPGTAAVDMSYQLAEAQKPSRLAIEMGGGGLHLRAAPNMQSKPTARAPASPSPAMLSRCYDCTRSPRRWRAAGTPP
jgi:hypothetical protein